MPSKVNWADVGVSVGGAAVLGVGLGLAIGFGARALGWPTGWIGPLTGGLVSGLVAIIYQRRVKGRNESVN